MTTTNQPFLQNSGSSELTNQTGAETKVTPENLVESPMSNDQQTIGNHSKWSNRYTDSVSNRNCGLLEPVHRLGILCAYSSLDFPCDLLNHALLFLQGLDQHRSFFWLSHPQGNLSNKFVPKMFNRIGVGRVWHILHDLNPLVLQEASNHPGCRGSCINCLAGNLSYFRVCFLRSLYNDDLLICC